MTDVYRPPPYISERQTLPAPDYLLDWYLKVRKEDDSWEVPVIDRGWRASSLGNCARDQTLVRRGIEPLRVFDAKTLRTFAWGDFVHDWVKGMYRELGLTIVEEPQLFDTSKSVSGHADLVFTINPMATPAPASPKQLDLRLRLADELDSLWSTSDEYLNQEPLGMEIKSVHSNAIKRVFNEGPYEHHQSQAGAYKLMSPTTGEVDTHTPGGGVLDMKDVERWFITYVGKDSVGLLTFEVEDRWVDTAAAKLDLLNRAWKAGVLPACTCKGWQVDYCSFNEGDTCCGRNQKGKVAQALRKAGV